LSESSSYLLAATG